MLKSVHVSKQNGKRSSVPETTTSESARHSSRDLLQGSVKWRGCHAGTLSGLSCLRVYSTMLSMSTLNTRAPSLASSAARGRPTTSLLLAQHSVVSKKSSAETGEIKGKRNLLMTVMVLPKALWPYLSTELYTPAASRALTIASDVHGKMALTSPLLASGSSL